jgi:hypothetical protein
MKVLDRERFWNALRKESRQCRRVELEDQSIKVGLESAKVNAGRMVHCCVQNTGVYDTLPPDSVPTFLSSF